MTDLFLFQAYDDGQESTTCELRGGEGTCSYLGAINTAWGSRLDPEIAIAMGLDTSQDGLLHQTRIAELDWQAGRRRCGGMALRVDPVTQETELVCPTGEAMKQNKPRQTVLKVARVLGKRIIR